MGKIANIRTKSIIEYKQQPFWNIDCQDFEDYLTDNDLLLCSMSNSDDCCDYTPNWEINRAALIEHVDNIKQEDSDTIAFGKHTYGELVKVFSEWLEISSNEENYSINDIIFIDWL